MNRKERTAQVHRFREYVAVAFGDASRETVYLCAGDARELALTLLRAAEDIEEHERFSESTFPTVELSVIA